MYEKRPTRWGDLPRHRNDIFLPVYKPRNATGPTAAIEAGYLSLPPMWDEETEDKSFRMLLDVFRNKQGAGGEFRGIKPTVDEILSDPKNLTYRLQTYDRDYPGYDYDDVIDCIHTVPELEALMRQSMILHNQYRWDPTTSSSTEVGKLRDDDYVIAYHPRNSDVLQFLRRVKRNGTRRERSLGSPRPSRPETLALSEPEKPYPPVIVRDSFKVLPRVEAIAVYEGEVPCTNKDLISNHAYCWSRMTEEDISGKTGIESRCYSELSLEDMSLLAVRAALTKSGRKPSEIGAVLFCSCTSTTLIPSIATWLSGELGLQPDPFIPATSSRPVRACLTASAEAVRLLQEIKRPVIVVCAEKFSDKIGTVRTSRMIFGDGAAAMVVGPAPAGAPRPTSRSSRPMPAARGPR